MMIFRAEMLASSHHGIDVELESGSVSASQVTQRAKLRVPPWSLQPHSDKMSFHARLPGLGSCHGSITGGPPSATLGRERSYQGTLVASKPGARHAFGSLCAGVK